jgi:predicted HTH transcriptional regulator
VTNDVFAANAWYFRNALVRANYNDAPHGIHATQEYLNRFFGNLLFGEKNILKNRELIITPKSWPVGDNVGDNVGVNSLILTELTMNPKASAKELATLIGRSQRTAERHIKELRSLGLLVRAGGDRGGHWEVIRRK